MTLAAILALFGSLLVVVFTAWLNTRTFIAQMDALRSELKGEMAALRAEVRGDISAHRAETRQGFAELRLEFHTSLSELSQRVERLEEHRGLVHP